jgi:hypothetical protein
MKKATTRKALPAGVAKVLKRLHYPLDGIGTTEIEQGARQLRRAA